MHICMKTQEFQVPVSLQTFSFHCNYQRILFSLGYYVKLSHNIYRFSLILKFIAKCAFVGLESFPKAIHLHTDYPGKPSLSTRDDLLFLLL